MAKATADTFQSFLESVLATVPEEKRDTVRATLTDDSIAPKLREGVLARSDYSRHMDELAKRRAEVDSYIAEQQERVKGWETWYADASTQLNETQSMLEKYRATYGDLTGTPAPALKREDIESLLAARIGKEREGLGTWMVDAVDKLTDLKIQHRQDFGERLDTRALSDFAAKHNLSDLDVAYKLYVEPTLNERRDADMKAKLGEARKQALEEGKRLAIAERFPAPGSRPGPTAQEAKDAVIGDASDRRRAAAAELETMLASL